MGSSTRDGPTVPSKTASSLAIVVAVLVVAGTLSLGVVGVTGNDPANAGGLNALSGSAAQPAPEATALSGSIPLNGSHAKLTGASANDSFGSALAYGDVNGDGVQDVVVGAPLNDTANGNNSGAVYVFYGPIDVGDLDAESANVTLLGEDESDRAGYSLATGDVNDDGNSDVVVGAPLEDGDGPNAGSAYVVYGGDLAGDVSLAAANHTFVGEAADDLAGWSVGTVNRTGGDSVLVGAPQNDTAGTNAGAAYVVSDAAPGTLSLGNATAKLTGEAAGDLAGWSVASAGDFDGDDSRDVVVGARLNNSTGSAAGAAYVVTENASGTVSLADAELKLAGVGDRDNAGWAVAEAGDVNNDSYGDVVVGAPFNDSAAGGTNAGAAYVVYGGPDVDGTMLLSEAGTTLFGEGPDDHAGWAVSSAGSGDVTCDEYADVLVGAPENNSTAPDAGAVYVVAGGEALGDQVNLSSASAKLAGAAANDSAGRAVSDAGDVTGDGDEDVLVGAPLNDSGGENAGAAYVVAGVCPEEPPKTTTTTTTETTERTTEKTTTKETTTKAPKLDIEASSPECEVLELENPTDEKIYVQFQFVDAPLRAGQLVLDPGETRRFAAEPGRIRLTASTASHDGERVLVNGKKEVVVRIDECPEPTTTTTKTTTTTTPTKTTTTTTTTPTETTTTTTKPEPRNIRAQLECERLVITNTLDVPIELTTIYYPEDETDFLILDPGESATFTDVGRWDFDAYVDTNGEFDFEETQPVTINGEQPYSVTIERCPSPPEEASAEISSPACEQLAIENTGDVELTYEVFDSEGNFVTDGTIQPGETATEELEAGEYEVDVRGPDDEIVANVEPLTIEACDDGGAEASAEISSPECEQLAIENTGDTELTYEVFNDTGVVASGTIQPGQTATEDLAPGEYEVDVRDGDGNIVANEESLTIEACEEASAEISSPECEQLAIENTGDVELTYEVFDSEGNFVTDGTIPAGETATEELEAGEYEVDVRGPDDEIVANVEAITIEACEEASAEISSPECEQLAIENTGDVELTYEVFNDTGVVASGTIAPGDNATEELAPGDYEVDVRGPDDEIVANVEPLTIEACEEASATIDNSVCEELRLNNTGDVELTYEIFDLEGDFVTDGTIPVGENVTVPLDPGEYEVDIRDSEGNFVEGGEFEVKQCSDGTTTDTTTDATTQMTTTLNDRAAISFVILCVDGLAEVPEESVGGDGADECPAGSKPLVRWEWDNDEFEAEDDEYGTNVVPIAFKEPGEPTIAQWTSSDYDILGVVVGSGGVTCTYTDPSGDGPLDEGTVESCEGSGPGSAGPPLGNQFPERLPVDPVQVPAVLGLTAAAGLVFRSRE